MGETRRPELSAPQGTGWWQCRALSPDGVARSLAGVRSDRYPDGVRVDLGEEAARLQIGADAVCIARYDDDLRVVALDVTPRGAAKAPPLWFVEVRESTSRPPAVNLIAFTGHGVAAGSLLADTDLGTVAVASDDQLGALRWYPATGEVDQIYVTPAWRRRSVATALLTAGAVLSVARDWPRFWGDGQRTALGERWRSASEWSHRAAGLTHVAPPMTPGDGA